MKDALKTIGIVLVGFAVMLGGVLAVTLMLRGGVWLSERIYPWLVLSSVIALIISALVLLPMAAFKKTRGYAGIGFFIVSYVFGITTWVWSLLLTYVIWGLSALVIGLFIYGVGVFPIALLATAFNGKWSIFCQLSFGLIATYITRFVGNYLALKSDEHDADSHLLNNPIREVVGRVIPEQFPEAQPPSIPPTIKIDCPHCEQRIEAPSEILGTDVSCPTCNRLFHAK